MIVLVPAARAGAAAPGCPPRTACDRALGIVIGLQPGWLRLEPPKVPAHVIVLVTRPASGPDYNVRLHIAAWGTTRDSNDARAARQGADRLVGEYRARRSVTRTPVRCGSAPGVLMRGLPGSPGPFAAIVLAHAGAVYLILAPGTALAPDQRCALATLRFIPRAGRFPNSDRTNKPDESGPEAGLVPHRLVARYFADLAAHRYYAAELLEAPCNVGFRVSNGPGAPTGSGGYRGRGPLPPNARAASASRYAVLRSVRVVSIRQLHAPILNRSHILAFGVAGWFRFDYSRLPWANMKHASGFHLVKIAVWQCRGRWGVDSPEWLYGSGGELTWT